MLYTANSLCKAILNRKIYEVNALHTQPLITANSQQGLCSTCSIMQTIFAENLFIHFKPREKSRIRPFFEIYYNRKKLLYNFFCQKMLPHTTVQNYQKYRTCFSYFILFNGLGSAYIRMKVGSPDPYCRSTNLEYTVYSVVLHICYMGCVAVPPGV